MDLVVSILVFISKLKLQISAKQLVLVALLHKSSQLGTLINDTESIIELRLVSELHCSFMILSHAYSTVAYCFC